MADIKHFTWQLRGYDYETESGRVAVKIEDDVITFEQIAGKAPPASLFAWGNVLNEAFEQDGQPFLVRARQAHASRRNRYAVIKRVGMSSAKDYRLIEERNADLADFPTRAVLHVSCAGKINEGFRMWIGDFYAIHKAWCEEHAHVTHGMTALMAEDDALVIHEAPTRQSAIEWRNAADEYAAEQADLAAVDKFLEELAA